MLDAAGDPVGVPALGDLELTGLIAPRGLVRDLLPRTVPYTQ